MVAAGMVAAGMVAAGMVEAGMVEAGMVGVGCSVPFARCQVGEAGAPIASSRLAAAQESARPASRLA